MRQAGEGADEIVAEADGVGRSEAESAQAGDRVDCFEELDKGAFFSDGREFVPSVKVDDLPEESDFFDSLADELADFFHDVGDCAGAFFSAGIGDNAEGATHITALHDGDEGRGLPRFESVVADG